MTMSSSVSKVTLNGDGVQTAWPFSFKVWKAADLEISITNAEGVTTVVSNWSVSLADTGGTVTYPTSGPALPSGHKITIARSMDFLQDVDLVSGTRWDPEVVETALDIACAERQQLKDKLSRAVTVDIASGTTPEALRDAIFAAKDTAMSSAASALNSAERAEIASSTVAYYNHEGTLLADEDTIPLPWAYDTEVGVEVFLGGVKQTESSLIFTDAYTVTLDAPVAADTPFEVVASVGAKGDLESKLSQPEGASLVGYGPGTVEEHLDSLSDSGGSSLVGFLQSGAGASGRTVQGKLRDAVSVKDFGAIGDGVVDDTVSFIASANAVGSGGQVIVPNGVYNITSNITAPCTWIFDALAEITGAGTLTPTGNYPGCRVVKLSDKDALWTNGTKIGTLSRWANSEFPGIEDNAELVVSSRAGLLALMGATRSSDWTTGSLYGMGTVGAMALALNDKTDVQVHSYAGYNEAIKNSGAGTTVGLEIDTVNRGAVLTQTPYSSIPWGSTVNLWLAAGGEKTPVNSSSLALGVKNNGATFQKGILFDADSLHGTNGNDAGTAIAIALAKGHRQVWYSPDGNIVGEIRSTAGSGTVPQHIDFTSAGLIMSDPTASAYYVDRTHKHKIYASDANTIVIRNGTSGPFWNLRNISNVFDLNNASGGNIGLSCGGNRKLTVAAGGDVFPENDGAQPLGGATKRWSVVYASSGTINTSDEREKQDVGLPDQAVLRAWARVDFKQFKFIDAVKTKGEEARWHFGLMAQQVKSAFEEEGLDAFRYGLLCYDKWDAEYEEVETTHDDPDAYKKDVQVQKVKKSTKIVDRVQVISGVATLVRKEEETAELCFEDIPVFDEKGSPVMVIVQQAKPAQLDSGGRIVKNATEAVWEQMHHRVPVMETETKYFKKILVREAGDRYGVRYEEALALECAYLRSLCLTPS